MAYVSTTADERRLSGGMNSIEFKRIYSDEASLIIYSENDPVTCPTIDGNPSGVPAR